LGDDDHGLHRNWLHGVSAEEQAAVPLRLNDQIANAETAFGRSFCLMVVQKLDRSALVFLPMSERISKTLFAGRSSKRLRLHPDEYR
jgi:hypothetical protein